MLNTSTSRSTLYNPRACYLQHPASRSALTIRAHYAHVPRTSHLDDAFGAMQASLQAEGPHTKLIPGISLIHDAAHGTAHLKLACDHSAVDLAKGLEKTLLGRQHYCVVVHTCLQHCDALMSALVKVSRLPALAGQGSTLYMKTLVDSCDTASSSVHISLFLQSRPQAREHTDTVQVRIHHNNTAQELCEHLLRTLLLSRECFLLLDVGTHTTSTCLAALCKLEKRCIRLQFNLVVNFDATSTRIHSFGQHYQARLFLRVEARD